ncbi:ABC transporter permease [Tsukamurella sp. NPDC003166]|uniref:ABC transporter permease n=1 Tax=Tsukamurella sp. NPDC003166 TaxID=3154444 RepID=UPI0033A78256
MTATLNDPAASPAPRGASGTADTGHLVRPAGRRRRTQPRWVDLVLRASVPVALLALWQVLAARGVFGPETFPSPAAVWDAFTRLVGDGTLADNATVSLRRAAVGFAIGGGLGLVLGVAAGLSRLGDQLLDPTVQMLRTIPFLAIAPLLILWFGIDEKPKIIIIAAAAMFPLYINTHGGVRQVDGKVIEAAHTFGLRGVGLIRQVVIPEALPSILVGLRVSLSVSLIALIVAEQSNAPKGIGFLMTSAQQFFQTDVLVLCIIIYALWGLGVDVVVRLLERLLMPYRKAARA